MNRRSLTWVAACMLLGSGIASATEVAEMTQLIRFLSERIATEDANLDEATRYKALLSSLEMMGVGVPPRASQAPLKGSDLAKLIIQGDKGPAPVKKPAGFLVLEEQLKTTSAATNPFEEVLPKPSFPKARSLPKPAPVSAPRLEVGPNPTLRASDHSAPVLVPRAPRAVRPVGPLPPQVVRKAAFEMPPVAVIARSLLSNPSDNPWKPEMKPVSRDYSSPRPGESYAPPAQGSEHFSQAERKAKLKNILSGLRSKRTRPPRVALPASSYAVASEATVSSNSQAAPLSHLEMDAVKDLAQRVLTGIERQPRIAVPEEGRVRLLEKGVTQTLTAGSHLVSWGARLEVEKGGRVLLVYPGEGTIFRLSEGSIGEVTKSGVQRIQGTVTKFLSRPGDTTEVLEPATQASLPTLARLALEATQPR